MHTKVDTSFLIIGVVNGWFVSFLEPVLGSNTIMPLRRANKENKRKKNGKPRTPNTQSPSSKSPDSDSDIKTGSGDLKTGSNGIEHVGEDGTVGKLTSGSAGKMSSIENIHQKAGSNVGDNKGLIASKTQHFVTNKSSGVKNEGVDNSSSLENEANGLCDSDNRDNPRPLDLSLNDSCYDIVNDLDCNLDQFTRKSMEYRANGGEQTEVQDYSSDLRRYANGEPIDRLSNGSSQLQQKTPTGGDSVNRTLRRHNSFEVLEDWCNRSVHHTDDVDSSESDQNYFRELIAYVEENGTDICGTVLGEHQVTDSTYSSAEKESSPPSTSQDKVVRQRRDSFELLEEWCLKAEGEDLISCVKSPSVHLQEKIVHSRSRATESCITPPHVAPKQAPVSALSQSCSQREPVTRLSCTSSLINERNKDRSFANDKSANNEEVENWSLAYEHRVLRNNGMDSSSGNDLCSNTGKHSAHVKRPSATHHSTKHKKRLEPRQDKRLRTKVSRSQGCFIKNTASICSSRHNSDVMTGAQNVPDLSRTNETCHSNGKLQWMKDFIGIFAETPAENSKGSVISSQSKSRHSPSAIPSPIQNNSVNCDNGTERHNEFPLDSSEPMTTDVVTKQHSSCSVTTDSAKNSADIHDSKREEVIDIPLQTEALNPTDEENSSSEISSSEKDYVSIPEQPDHSNASSQEDTSSSDTINVWQNSARANEEEKKTDYIIGNCILPPLPAVIFQEVNFVPSQRSKKAGNSAMVNNSRVAYLSNENLDSKDNFVNEAECTCGAEKSANDDDVNLSSSTKDAHFIVKVEMVNSESSISTPESASLQNKAERSDKNANRFEEEYKNCNYLEVGNKARLKTCASCSDLTQVTMDTYIASLSRPIVFHEPNFCLGVLNTGHVTPTGASYFRDDDTNNCFVNQAENLNDVAKQKESAAIQEKHAGMGTGHKPINGSGSVTVPRKINGIGNGSKVSPPIVKANSVNTKSSPAKVVPVKGPGVKRFPLTKSQRSSVAVATDMRRNVLRKAVSSPNLSPDTSPQASPRRLITPAYRPGTPKPLRRGIYGQGSSTADRPTNTTCDLYPRPGDLQTTSADPANSCDSLTDASCSAADKQKLQLKIGTRQTSLNSSPGSTRSASPGFSLTPSPGSTRSASPVSLSPGSPQTFTKFNGVEAIALMGAELEAVTNLYTLCNGQQQAKIIKKATAPSIVQQPTEVKEPTKVHWASGGDLVEVCPKVVREPPTPGSVSEVPGTILTMHPITWTYPYADELNAPVVVRKLAKKSTAQKIDPSKM